MKAGNPHRARHVASLRLEICAETAPQYIPFLKDRLAAAHAVLHPPLAELSVAIVAARRMAALHRQFLGRSGATDVLTFELERDSASRPTAGEIVICAAVARRRARQYCRPVAHELLLYALHGMLHLCGFDDKTPAAFKVMHVKEDEILTRLGIGPVFAATSFPRSIRSALGDRRCPSI